MAKEPSDRTRVPAFADHDSRKGRSITANVTQEHYGMVERIASARGVSIANYAREAVLTAAAQDLKVPVDLSCYADMREIAGRYRMSKTEFERVAIADYMRRHSPPAEGNRVPHSRRGKVVDTARTDPHESGQFESPGPMRAAAKVVSSPPPRRRGR